GPAARYRSDTFRKGHSKLAPTAGHGFARIFKDSRHRRQLAAASYNALAMRWIRQPRLLYTCFAALVIPAVLVAAKDFSMPLTNPAFSYPAHDRHTDENVTVAVDPYETAAKANIFTVHYSENELLPLLVVITNDSDQPVQLSEMKAELVTSDRTKLTPLGEEDIFRRLSHPKASGTRYPVPFPTKKAKGGVDSKSRDEVESALFRAKAVEPRSTQAGFMFFDTSDVSNPLQAANFYLTGVRDSTGHDLMYFEISLDKYLESSKSP